MKGSDSLNPRTLRMSNHKMGDGDLGLLSSEMVTFKASAVAGLRSLRSKAVISGCNSQSYIIARSWRVADIAVELYRDETTGIARNKA